MQENVTFLTTAVLIRLCQNPENETLWCAFVARYAPIIYGWCRQRGLQAANAEDVTQRILLNIVQAIRKGAFVPKTTARSWIGTITRNACANFHRDQKRASQEPGIGGSDYSLFDSVDAVDDLARLIEAEHASDVMELASCRVREVVSSEEWYVWHAHKVEGCQCKDLAEELGYDAAKITRMHQAVAKLLRAEVERIENRVF